MKKNKCTGLKGTNLTSIMCCGYLNETLLCGSINGNLLICSGKQFTKTREEFFKSSWREYDAY
jgi:hypothetical protein